MAKKSKVQHTFSSRGLVFAATFSVLVIVGGGVVFTMIERPQHLSVGDGLYWATTTITALGSQVGPTTVVGKILAVLVLLVGSGFVAMITAAIAERFITNKRLDPNEDTADAEVVERLDEISRRLDRIEKRRR